MDKTIRKMGTQLKVGDKVKILYNDLEPKYIGCIAIIAAIHPAFHRDAGYVNLYRVSCNGKFLKGVAHESDLEHLENG